MKIKFTLRKKITSIFFIAFMFIMQSNAQTWTIYDGSVLPDAANPAWATGDLGTPEAVYSIVDDIDIPGNKLLYDTTSAGADKKSYKLNITQPTNATWMIRTKAGNDNPVSMEFEMNAVDGASAKFRINVRLYNDVKGGYLKTNYLTTNVTYPADSNLTVQTFHTLRITVENGSAFKVYLDENTTPIIDDTGATGSSQSQFLRFGDVGSTFTEGYVDWMAWDVTGAYAPGTGTLPTGVKIDGVSVGIKENQAFKPSVFPNPAHEFLNIKNASGINKYEILSVNGMVIKRAINKDNNVKIDLKGMKPGMYILKTYSNGKTEQTKFIMK